MNLYGDPLNLQGGGQTLQGGSGGSLIPAYNPQQAANPYGPTAPTIAAPRPVSPVTPVRVLSSQQAAPRPTALPQQLNPIFDSHIGTRASAINPGVLEYYNKQTGQGFSNSNDLFAFASSLGAGQINSFDQLHAPIANYASGSTPVISNPGADLARNAGLAGLSPDDYTKLVQGQNALTPDEYNALYGSLGIPELEQNVFAPPDKSTVDLYNQAYSAAGLSDLKTQIQNTIDEINKLNSAYTNKAGQIDENPFLSEASRIGRQKILNDQKQEQIGNLVTGLQNYQNLYNTGIGEVSALVQRHTADFTQNQSLNAQKLQYLLSRAETLGNAEVAQKNQAAYQYLPDYLKAKANATAGTTVNAGNGATYYWDKNSGTFVQLSGPNVNAAVNSVTGDLYSQNTGQIIGQGGGISIPAGTLAAQNNNPGNLRYVGQPGATQGAGGFARFNSPEEGLAAYQAQVQLDASRGLTLGQFITKYAPPSENNTAQYIQQAVSALGVNANTPLSQVDLNALTQFQLRKESGTTFNAGVSGESPDVLTSLAQELVSGQIAPSQIKGRAQADKIFALADQFSRQQTGRPFDQQAAEINYQNAGNIRPTVNNEAAVESHFQTLEQISDKLNRSSNALVNEATLNFKRANGDSLTNQYFQTISDIQGEIAKVLTGTGASTDDARKQAGQLINPYLGQQALKDAIANATALMKQKIAQYSQQRSGSGEATGLQMPAGYAASSPDLSDLNFHF